MTAASDGAVTVVEWWGLLGVAAAAIGTYWVTNEEQPAEQEAIA